MHFCETWELGLRHLSVLFHLENQVAGYREAAVTGAQGWLMQHCVHEELGMM